MHRRAFLTLLAAALTGACKARPSELRCKHCGMRIETSSPWRTELIGADGAVTNFDTPRCALSSWRSGKSSAVSVRVQEYYERRWLGGGDVRFIIGGDVLGPMGHDLVPVDPARATKFIQDHGADRALTLDEVNMDVLRTIQ